MGNRGSHRLRALTGIVHVMPFSIRGNIRASGSRRVRRNSFIESHSNRQFGTFGSQFNRALSRNFRTNI